LEGRPSCPLGVGQGGDVAADQVVGFGVPDGALERQVPHAHRRGGIPGCHRGQRPPYVSCGQLAELPGADGFEDRLQDVLVLLDRLGRAALQPVGEPVLSGLADGCPSPLPGDERPQMPRVAPHSRDPDGPGAATASDGV
jgi:hypothetical protein